MPSLSPNLARVVLNSTPLPPSHTGGEYGGGGGEEHLGRGEGRRGGAPGDGEGNPNVASPVEHAAPPPRQGAPVSPGPPPPLTWWRISLALPVMVCMGSAGARAGKGE